MKLKLVSILFAFSVGINPEDEEENPDADLVVKAAFENVKKIFENLQQEGGKEKAVEDLEQLIGQADQFLANSFSLTKENIEELINDLVDGSYSEKEFEQDLEVAQNAASTLYKNILEGGERAPETLEDSVEMFKEILDEEGLKVDLSAAKDVTADEGVTSENPISSGSNRFHPQFSSIDHLTPISFAETALGESDSSKKCHESCWLNGEKTVGCSHKLRRDRRPWCSTDEVFEGNFVFCPESEAEAQSRLSAVKSEELYQEGSAILASNSRNERYQIGITKLLSAVELGNADAELYLAKLKIFGLHAPQDIVAGFATAAKLASVGNSAAQALIGNMYGSGVGVAASQPKALLNLNFAALDGSHEAHLALGYRYHNGIGVTKSCSAAQRHYAIVAADVASNAQKLTHAPYINQVRIVEEDQMGEDSSEVLLDEELLQYYAYLAEKGDIGSQVNLAQLLLQRGFDDDVSRAANLFQLAADNDHPLGAAFLGRMYLEGVGVKPDNHTAFKLFRKAAEKGNAIGQAGLGLMYLEGRATDMNEKKAIRYFQQSADQGWNDGQLRLGLAYLQGTGVRKDPKEALKYLSLASREHTAGFGNILAFWYMADIYAHGLGVPKNCERSVAYYKFVAEHGPWNRLFIHAWAQWKDKNVESAFAIYSYLAELGFEKAQSNAAAILDNYELGIEHYDETRYPRALAVWKRAASQNFAHARLRVGDYYWYGLGVAENFVEAAQHYRLASEDSDPAAAAQAFFNLGYMHQYGSGLPKDFYLSKRFYDMAAERSPEANLPATIALAGLGLSFVYERVHWLSDLSLNSLDIRYLNSDTWDLWLMTILVLLLSFVYAYRRNR